MTVGKLSFNKKEDCFGSEIWESQMDLGIGKEKWSWTLFFSFFNSTRIIYLLLLPF